MDHFFNTILQELQQITVWQHVVIEVFAFSFLIVIITVLHKFFKKHLKIFIWLAILSFLVVAVSLALSIFPRLF